MSATLAEISSEGAELAVELFVDAKDVLHSAEMEARKLAAESELCCCW